MSPALPGSRGLFSALQAALQHTERHRVRITRQIHHLARDFLALLQSIHERPTRLPDLATTYPSDRGVRRMQAGYGRGVVRRTRPSHIIHPMAPTFPGACIESTNHLRKPSWHTVHLRLGVDRCHCPQGRPGHTARRARAHDVDCQRQPGCGGVGHQRFSHVGGRAILSLTLQRVPPTTTRLCCAPPLHPRTC